MRKVLISPTWSAARAILDRGEYPSIKPLNGITIHPTMDIDTPGYDESSGLLYIPNTIYPPVPRCPSREDAQQGAREILDLVSDFPFLTGHEFSWLSALLTPLARFSIAGPCPLFLIEATTPSSGKSFLTDLISLTVSGGCMSRMGWPTNEEERRKLFTSMALAGQVTASFDNVEGRLGGATLNAALTATVWNDRVLGKSEMSGDIPFITVLFATSNNPDIEGDTVRRLVPIRLEPREEKPEERINFKYPDLFGHVQENRGRLVVAGLTILRAYQVAGSPPSGLKPLGSYEAWCRVVRDSIHYATGQDAIASRECLKESDSGALERAALVEGWAGLPGAQDEGLTASEAIRVMQRTPGEYGPLREVLTSKTRDGSFPSAQKVGALLRGLRGRVVGGMKLESVPLRSNQQAWRVVRA